MTDDRLIRRTEMRERLMELRSAAIAELERRGYDVRGKTPAQIRRALKLRPFKRAAEVKGGQFEPPTSEQGANVITQESNTIA